MLGTINFKFCNSFVKALRELCFAENLIRIRLPKIQFCPAENNKIQKEFHTVSGVVISQKQYSWHTIHST